VADAGPSKAYVCGRLVGGIGRLNPAKCIDVYPFCFNVGLSYVGTGLCDGLITRPGDSYRASNCV
jgi:hypothetical protein